VSIDIITYRAPAPGEAWESLPIVDPIRVEPGVPARFPVPATADAESLDVVIAWTAHHGTGDLPASRLFRIPAGRELAGIGPGARALGGWTALLLLTLLGAAGALVVRSAVASDATHDAGDSVTTTSAVSSSATTPDSTPAPDSTPPTSDGAASTSSVAPDTTATVTVTVTLATIPATTTPPTAPSTAPTTEPTTTDATTDPTTTSGPAPTTSNAPAGGRQVVAEARSEPCRFGDDCLVVGFRLEGFPNPPAEYVCEFDDGTRFTFRFDSQGVETACATGRAGAAITVEVDGVRSQAVTR
jgi:hypothetical protein